MLRSFKIHSVLVVQLNVSHCLTALHWTPFCLWFPWHILIDTFFLGSSMCSNCFANLKSGTSKSQTGNWWRKLGFRPQTPGVTVGISSLWCLVSMFFPSFSVASCGSPVPSSAGLGGARRWGIHADRQRLWLAMDEYMGCHPFHWRTPSFFKMVIAPPTRLRNQRLDLSRGYLEMSWDFQSSSVQEIDQRMTWPAVGWQTAWKNEQWPVSPMNSWKQGSPWGNPLGVIFNIFQHVQVYGLNSPCPAVYFWWIYYLGFLKWWIPSRHPVTVWVWFHALMTWMRTGGTPITKWKPPY